MSNPSSWTWCTSSGERADADPEPLGAEERAYIAAFSDARANNDRNQAGLLSTAVGQPNLAESLIYLNQRLDRQDLDPREPVGILGIIVRLAMDGLWVSDILDSTRFKPADRRRITDVLTGMTYRPTRGSRNRWTNCDRRRRGQEGLRRGAATAQALRVSHRRVRAPHGIIGPLASQA